MQENPIIIDKSLYCSDHLGSYNNKFKGMFEILLAANGALLTLNKKLKYIDFALNAVKI